MSFIINSSNDDACQAICDLSLKDTYIGNFLKDSMLKLNTLKNIIIHLASIQIYILSWFFTFLQMNSVFILFEKQINISIIKLYSSNPHRRIWMKK